MRRAGSAMIALSAALAATAATAAGILLLTNAPISADLRPPEALAADLGVSMAQAWEAAAALGRDVRAWLAEGTRRAPALMLALGIVLAVPLLAMLGHLLRPRRADAGVRGGQAGEDIVTTRAVAEGLAWPASAVLRVDGGRVPERLIAREIISIGREDDNDLCLSHPTVHRYHAIVRRTPESDFVLVDLSSREGKGVSVNGRRVAQARLRDGDVIGVGEMLVRFETRPA